MAFLFAGNAQAATSTSGKHFAFGAPVTALHMAGADRQEDKAFDVAPVGDAALADTVGEAQPARFLRAANASYSESTFQQTSANARVGLDNWFNDVAQPLIVANLGRGGGIT